MRSRAVVLALALVAAPMEGPAQSRPGNPAPAFEVATIKRNTSGSENYGFALQPGGVVVVTNATARQMIRYTYRMQNSRVEGGPEWVDTEHYDITAKAAGAVTADQMLPMMRTLLAERLKLVVHMEARDAPIFSLVLSRSDRRLGPQLRPSPAVDCAAVLASQAQGVPLVSGGRPVCAGRTGAGFITAGAVTMEQIARNMSGLVGRLIVDRTELQGRYDFDLKFAPDAQLTAPAGAGAPAELPSLFVALEEQLGLKLEAGRAPVDLVVIDSIARPVED